MKRLIVLSVLFIVGCDNSTEPTVDPLVGIWEGTEMTVSNDQTSITYQLNDPTSDAGTITYIFGEDGVFSNTSISSSGTESYSGTWSSTGGKLTMIDDEGTEVLDFTISGNTLTISMVEDGVNISATFTKQ